MSQSHSHLFLMSSSSSTLIIIQNWLKEASIAYPNSQRVQSDILSVLNAFNSLKPKSDVYSMFNFYFILLLFNLFKAFDDGRTQLLLCVHGLLPIVFRGASYNIPIAVWIQREYPRHPPIAYVVPTTDMLVKPGKHVDVSGLCNLEYSQQWQRKPEVSFLLAFYFFSFEINGSSGLRSLVAHKRVKGSVLD